MGETLPNIPTLPVKDDFLCFPHQCCVGIGDLPTPYIPRLPSMLAQQKLV